MERAEELAGLRLENAVLKRRAEDLSLLLRLSAVFHALTEPQGISALLLTAVTAGHALGFNRAFLFLADPKREFLEGVLGVGPVGAEAAYRIWGKLSSPETTVGELVEEAMHRMEEGESARLTSLAHRIRVPLAAGGGILGKTLSRGRPFLIWPAGDEVEEDRDLRRDLGLRQAVSVPLASRELPLGVLLADNLYSERPISHHQVELLSSLAHHAGLALERVGRSGA